MSAGSSFSLAAYCPDLSDGKEENAAKTILFYYPVDTDPNEKMNKVGFCIATSDLRNRFRRPKLGRKVPSQQEEEEDEEREEEYLARYANLNSEEEDQLVVYSEQRVTCCYTYRRNIWIMLEGPSSIESSVFINLLKKSFRLFESLYNGPKTPVWEDLFHPRLSRMPTPGRDVTKNYCKSVLVLFYSRLAFFLDETVFCNYTSHAPRAGNNKSASSTQWEERLRQELLLSFPSSACGGTFAPFYQRLANHVVTSFYSNAPEKEDEAPRGDAFFRRYDPQTTPNKHFFVIFELENFTVLASTIPTVYASLLKLYAAVFSAEVTTGMFTFYVGGRSFQGYLTRSAAVMVIVLTPAELPLWHSEQTTGSCGVLVDALVREFSGLLKKQTCQLPVDKTEWGRSEKVVQGYGAQPNVWLTWQRERLGGIPLAYHPRATLPQLTQLMRSLRTADGGGKRVDRRREVWIPYGVWWLSVVVEKGKVMAVSYKRSVPLSDCFIFAAQLENVNLVK